MFADVCAPRFYLLWLLLLLVLLLGLQLPSAAAAPAAVAPAPRLPLESFYRDPILADVELSPDGTHLLALKNVRGETAILVHNLKTGEQFYPVKTDNKEFKFNWIRWANDDRILMSLRFSSSRGTTQRFDETRLLATDAKKSSPFIALVRPNEDAVQGWISQFQDNIISMLPEDPEHILVSVDRDVPLHQSVYKANVYTGKLARVQRAKSSIDSWMADRQGVVRLGKSYDDKKRRATIKVLEAGSKKWVDAWSYVQFDEPPIRPLGFGGNPNELYLLADHEGRQALYKADLSQPNFPKTLVLHDPEYDMGGRLIYSRVKRDVVGIYSRETVFFDKDFAAFQAGVDKALPDADNYIISLSDNDRKYLLHSESSTDPGTLFYGDRDTRQLTPVAAQFPELTPDVLVKKLMHKYKARDGLELDGYLSLPKHYAGNPMATIIFPHGGPMAEDGDGFDPFSAFMVNRGYAVFQPNFRGSSGRVHDFMMRAIGGLGLEMQDDLEDAVAYLVQQKIADPARVCIVGASYGGYAALMGAAKTPDLFRCAVSFAGMADLVKMRESFRYYANKNTYREQFGNDKQQLKETSPARLVERFKIPILLIHGDKDTSVPVTQSRLMADRLKDAGKAYEYVELEEGTHHLDYLPHRQKTFEVMEAFLQRHLPVD